MIPKFDTDYKNLHSSFLVCDIFLSFLKNEYFNGFVLIEGHNKKAYMFMFEGETQSSLCATDTGYKKITPAEFSSLLAKDSYISTCRCFPEQIDLFSQAHTAKQVFNIPAKKNTDPTKLIRKCQKGEFTGYLQSTSSVNKDKIFVYFYNGSILGSMNLNNKDYSFEKTPDKTTIQNKLLNTEIHLFKLSPEVRDKKKDLQSLIDCYEEIFKQLKAQNKSHDFSSLWRKCALELSDTFVFLDPFGGDFKYTNGKIEIWEEININTAIHGIDELVHLIAKRIDISDNVIQTVKNKYLNLFGAYEIRQ